MSMWNKNQVLSSLFTASAIAFGNGAVANAAPNTSWSQKPSWSDEGTPLTLRNRAPRVRDANTPSATSTSSSSTIYGNDLSPYAPGSNNLALDLGQVFLMGDLSKFSDSIGMQIHYTYGVSDVFGFDSSVGYSEHSEGKYSMTTLLSGLRINLSWYDKVVPYAIFGLGFYKPSFQDHTAQPSNGTNNSTLPSLSSVLFGVHLGPGIDLELTKNLFFGAGITFHNMFASTKTLANGTVQDIGGTYTSFFLHAGATF
jgi:opacity protein-like surface antigen